MIVRAFSEIIFLFLKRLESSLFWKNIDLAFERENLYKECVPILEKLVSINENQEAVKTLMNIYGTLGNNEGFKQMKSLLQ